ncbi:MAG: glycosyltransferase [Gemmobacter sp.]|nr:glycosyltransferase [Gemmobacter sp.]
MTAGTALVLGVTGNLDFAAGALIAGFLHHNPEFSGDIVVLHDGLSDAALAALSRLAPRLVPLPYDRATALSRLATAGLPDPAMLDRLGRWGAMTLAKFEMFDWFDRYDAVVWMDADILVQAPVPDLWQAGPLAWRALPQGALDRRRDVLAALGHPAGGVPLPNAGVVVARAALRTKGLRTADLYALAARLLAQTPARSVDELALWLAASAGGLTVQPLPQDLNHPADQPGSHSARIVHAIGPDKFWNAPPLRQGFAGWDRAHTAWVAAGGTVAPAPDRLLDVHPADPATALTFARNRAFWTGLWPVLGPALPRGMWPDLRTERAFQRHYPAGAARGAWVDLGRTASPRRLRLSIGVEPRKLADPALPARIDTALARSPELTLPRHDGRRLIEWTTEKPLDEVAETVQSLRDVLTLAMEG